MAGFKRGKKGYTIVLSSLSAFNPADATTYYFGINTLNTTEGMSRVYIPKSGIIKSCYVHTATSVNASNETSTLSIRVNNTTDNTVSSSYVQNSTYNLISNTSMSVSISAGDYIEMKWVTPTWNTNPTSLQITVTIYIE